jgi:hypothetical protein
MEHPREPVGDLLTECLKSSRKELFGKLLRAYLKKPVDWLLEEALKEVLKEPLEELPKEFRELRRRPYRWV